MLMVTSPVGAISYFRRFIETRPSRLRRRSNLVDFFMTRSLDVKYAGKSSSVHVGEGEQRKQGKQYGTATRAATRRATLRCIMSSRTLDLSVLHSKCLFAGFAAGISARYNFLRGGGKRRKLSDDVAVACPLPRSSSLHVITRARNQSIYFPR